MDIVRAVLFGALPGLAAGLLLVGVLGRRFTGLAMAIGVFAAYALIKEPPPWPHDLWAGTNSGEHWFLWFALGAGVLSVAGGRRLWSQRIALPLGAAWFGAQIWLMLTLRRPRMATQEAVLHHGSAFLLVVFVWLVARQVADRQKGIGLGVVWTACLVVDSVVLLLGKSASQGQLAGGAAAALGAAVGTALWRRPFAVGTAAALPLASLHGGLLLAGYHFSYLPASAALCAAVAPTGMLAAGATSGPDGSRAAGAGRFAAGAVITGLLATAAVVLAATTEQ